MDKTEIKRTETGIFTAEGNVAGARAGRMAMQRQEQKEDFEKRKKDIENNQSVKVSRIDDKFNSYVNYEEAEFKVGFMIFMLHVCRLTFYVAIWACSISRL
jgi:hypothetical protein